MIRPFESRQEGATPAEPVDDGAEATPVVHDEAVSRLAGGIAHELGNLLTSILGYAELLHERLPPGSEEDEDASRIVQAALRGRTITSQLSALGRERHWQPRRVDLNQTVRSLGPRLHDVLPGSAPLMRLDDRAGAVEVDPSTLEKVLLGLALSVETAAGEGPIEIRTSPVDLEHPRTASSGGRAVPAGTWETVSFGPVARIGARSGAWSGAPGPGLAVADALVTRAGGVVVSEGTSARPRLTMYLPRAGALRSARRPGGAPAAAGASILLVEDQDHVRDVLARRLEKEGYVVHQARDGMEALQRLDELARLPDLVLTDVMMPRMGGRELAKELSELAPDLPVLFMSGYTGSEIPRGDELPAIPDEDLLTKPFSSGELLDHVARRLERRPA